MCLCVRDRKWKTQGVTSNKNVRKKRDEELHETQGFRELCDK